MTPISPKPPTPPRSIGQAASTPSPVKAKTPSKRHPRIVRKPSLSRRDVAAAVASKLKLSANKARAVVDAVLEAVKAAVRAGHAVELRGFARFEIRNVKARSRVNMADVKAGKKGAAVGRLVVPAHAVVKATASPVFLGSATKTKVCK